MARTAGTRNTTSPAQRSLKFLRDKGWYCEIVEHWNSFARLRKDMLGFVDIFCIHRETGEIKLVQTTSASNVSARINKITAHENLPLVRKAGMGIEVHGWSRGRNGWVCRVEDIS